jgi:dTDP-4-amino-4,6-dideoxygalactose transaminase
MKPDAFQVVRDFERAVADYTGAPYVVSVNSCSMAILLAVAWHLRTDPHAGYQDHGGYQRLRPEIDIPKRTYISVPMSIIHAGGRPTFRDEEWVGAYQLKPLPVWDSARWFSQGMYIGMPMRMCGDIMTMGTQVDRVISFAGSMVCTSHHWSKTLGIQQGGCILHDDPEADAWLRRSRFDGRTEGVAPKDDTFTQIGWHAYMSPEVAAEGLVRIQHLPRHNAPLPNDQYPDLSTMEIFR